MEWLVQDWPRCRLLAEAACRRVAVEFTWSAKAAHIREAYMGMLEQCYNKPRRTGHKPLRADWLPYPGLADRCIVVAVSQTALDVSPDPAIPASSMRCAWPSRSAR
jgi:hypothetical protein